MPKFGDYETIDEPIRVTEAVEHVSTLWKVRHTLAQDGLVYLAKSLSLRAPEVGASGVLAKENQNGAVALDFLEGSQQLKKAQEENSPFLAPIHACGSTESGAWYVTDFYPRKTLKEYIGLQGGVESKALEHVVYCVVSGCLALQRSTGRSHGNLKASNVLLSGKPQLLRKTPLRLIDPRPVHFSSVHALRGAPQELSATQLQEQTEQADLRAIGELILQLVEGRIISSSYDYNYPVPPSAAWNGLGKDAERWRQRCNQLLNPRLKLTETNLSALENEFRPRPVETHLPRIVAGCVGVGLVIGSVVYVANRASRGGGQQERTVERGEWARLMTAAQEAGGRDDWRTASAMLSQALRKAQELKDPSIRAQTDNELAYARIMADGLSLLEEGQAEAAKQQAEIALQQRPNERAAKDLKTRAQVALDSNYEKEFNRLLDAAVQAESLEQWARAVDLLSQAVARADTLKNQALRARATEEIAYAQKMDAAEKLLADPAHAQPQLARAKAMEALALRPRQTNAFTRLATRADLIARIQGLKPDNGTNLAGATQVVAQGQNNVPVAGSKPDTQAEENYRSAWKAGQKALEAGDTAEAIRQADLALGIKKNDPQAAKLKVDAGAEQNYQTAWKAGQKALAEGDTAEAIWQADLALGIKKNDPQATKLKADAQAEQNYQTAWKAGQKAWEQGDPAEAIRQADVVLSIKQNDPQAAKLKAEAQAEQNYRTAWQAGRKALAQGNIREAIRQADVALGIKQNDPQAAKLKADAQAEQNYELAWKAAQKARAQGDWSKAIEQADVALSMKQNDPQAAELKAEAQVEQSYQTALKAAQDAYNRGDFAQAIKQAGTALTIKTNDAEAASLKQAASQQIARNDAARTREQSYQTALNVGQAALERRDYTNAIAQADIALRLKSGDEAAATLKRSAQQDLGFQGAGAAFNQGDYAKALKLCQPFAGSERFDDLTGRIAQEEGQLRLLQETLKAGGYPAVAQGTWPNKPPFQRLKAQANEESKALQDAGQKFAGGDYSYLDALPRQSFASKPPFASLLSAGQTEREQLRQLQALKQPHQRPVLRAELSKLPSAVRGKPPFAALAKWAESEPVETPASVAINDKKLAFWEIHFGVKARPAGSEVEVLRDPTKDRAYNLQQFDRLEKEYASAGCLDTERQRRINALRWRVSRGSVGAPLD